jgi:prepilin-type N-terminal cleavage/methylation domain-containing protein
MKVRRSQAAGFTLTEIMIVVGIIGLLTPIAIPNFLKARATSQMNTCINNLRQIDGAKQQWATETGRTATALPTSEDIRPYLNREPGTLEGLRCPQDPAKSFATSYTVGNMTTCPVCNIQPTTHLFK